MLFRSDVLVSAQVRVEGALVAQDVEEPPALESVPDVEQVVLAVLVAVQAVPAIVQAPVQELAEVVALTLVQTVVVDTAKEDAPTPVLMAVATPVAGVQLHVALHAKENVLPNALAPAIRAAKLLAGEGAFLHAPEVALRLLEVRVATLLHTEAIATAVLPPVEVDALQVVVVPAQEVAGALVEVAPVAPAALEDVLESAQTVATLNVLAVLETAMEAARIHVSAAVPLHVMVRVSEHPQASANS